MAKQACVVYTVHILTAETKGVWAIFKITCVSRCDAKRSNCSYAIINSDVIWIASWASCAYSCNNMFILPALANGVGAFGIITQQIQKRRR
jgi:hypothetical protein